MPRFRVLLLVEPKPSARDPEGETLARELRRRGYRFVEAVRAGKAFEVTVEAGDGDEAVRLVEEMAREARLYNPLVHTARVMLVG